MDAIQKVETNQNGALSQNNAFDSVTINTSNLKEVDFNNYAPTNLDLEVGYFSPQNEGEAIRVVFVNFIENDTIPDFNDPKKTVLKPCVYFLTQIDLNGEKFFKMVRCGASRLVSYFTETIEVNGQMVKVANPALLNKLYDVIFAGKKKNKSNNNLSSVFVIRPLTTIQK